MCIDHTLLDDIELLCFRPGIHFPYANSSAELFAAIRGLCTGVDDPEGSYTLEGFPTFVLQFVSNSDEVNEKWLDALSRWSVNKSLLEASRQIKNLLIEWKQSTPILPKAPVRGKKGNERDEAETIQLIEDIFRKPAKWIPGVATLGEVLHFIEGLRLSRFPPHGYFHKGWELHQYLQTEILGEFKGGRKEKMLLDKYRNVPLIEACTDIADLIHKWRRIVRRAAQASPGRRTPHIGNRGVRVLSLQGRACPASD